MVRIEYDASHVITGHREMTSRIYGKWYARAMPAIGKGSSAATVEYLRRKRATGQKIAGRTQSADPGEWTGRLAASIMNNFQVIGPVQSPVLACANMRRFPPYWLAVNFGSAYHGNEDQTTERYATTPWGFILIERYGRGHWRDRLTRKWKRMSGEHKSGDGDDWVEDEGEGPGSGDGNYSMIKPGRTVITDGYHFIKFWWKDGVRRTVYWSKKIWTGVAQEVNAL